jgi:hypothetical protein
VKLLFATHHALERTEPFVVCEGMAHITFSDYREPAAGQAYEIAYDYLAHRSDPRRVRHLRLPGATPYGDDRRGTYKQALDGEPSDLRA